jgi:hypothetical protein
MKRICDQNRPRDGLALPVLCLNCGHKTTLGKLVCKNALHCPLCDSPKTQPMGKFIYDAMTGVTEMSDRYKAIIADEKEELLGEDAS